MGTPQAPFELPADLRSRAGQLILAGFRGLTPLEAGTTLRQVRSGVLGAVLLYDLEGGDTGLPRNIQSRAQLKALLDALHAAAPAGPPLLAAMDEEGGYYHRLKTRYGFFDLPSPSQLGSGGDLCATAAAGHRIAEAYAELGIGLNLAPVVDLAKPEGKSVAGLGRAFSADPQIVVDHARAFVEAHRQHGIATALKHFPGSGSAAFKQDIGMEVATGWEPKELEPFRALIGERLADAVVVTRARVPALDQEFPPMLSERVLDGLLRQEMGFDGAAITDAMEMMSIWGRYGFERSIVLALRAGIDLILFCNNPMLVDHDPDRGERAAEVIVDAVERGEVSEARVDEACARVLALKARIGRPAESSAT